MFDMVTFAGISNINEVLDLKSKINNVKDNVKDNEKAEGC